jgi:putative ABC transport system ATP-binding protein
MGYSQMPENQPLLSCRKLAYTAPSGNEILRGVDLDLHQAEVLWVGGPSGGGKTTLLRLLCGLISPTGGEISFLGKPVSSFSPTLYRRKVALLMQMPVILAGSIQDNLMWSFNLKAARGRVRPEADELQSLLERLGLDSTQLEMAADDLSVGQKQRVALARLILMRPKVLLLDEPVASLDSDSRALVEAEAGYFAARNGAVIMVSHLEPKISGAKHMQLIKGMRGKG